MKNKLLREPLLHFFALGLLLFVLYAAVSGTSGPDEDEIVVDAGRIAGLRSAFEATWRRPPTDAEMESAIEAFVREEILYREGVAAGFDRNDPVIRRRVAQKMSFVADGMVPEVPDEAALNEWLQDNIEDYEIPARLAFRQVYIDPQRHPNDLETVLEQTLADLVAGADPGSLGDSTLLIGEFSSVSSVDVARNFGGEFTAALEQTETGSWQGPVRSGYGLHFVFISEYIPAREPTLDDVRAAVERDLLNAQSQQINDAFYEALRERYNVTIETVEAGS